ncbi:MAG: MFS transporter [Chloroflexi bacterium]|nr:MFS transporter [Chloroflexota bacterium]
MLKRDGQAYEWTLVISLALVFGFVGLNRAGIGFVMPPIVQEFHLEFWQAGLLVSGTSLAWAISAWLSGSISDRIGRKKVYLFGMYGASVISMLMGLAWNFLSLFILRDLVGLGDGVSLATGQGTIAERTNPNRRALYQGIFTGGYTLFGLALGAFIMTHLATAFGWRWAFPLVGIYGALLVTGMIFILPADLPAHTREAAGQLKPSAFFTDLKEILGARGMPSTTIAFTLGLAWLGLNLAFYALFLTQIRGYALNDAGNILASGALIGLLGVLIIPSIADNFGRKPAAIVASVAACVGFLTFALVPLPPLAMIPLLGLGQIGASGLNALAGATMPSELVPQRKGAAIGICNLFAATLGITLSPIIGGILADRFGLMVPVVLAGLLWVVNVVILLPVPETAPRILARRGVVSAEGHEQAMPAPGI